MANPSDRDLGMDRPIKPAGFLERRRPRADRLSGVSLVRGARAARRIRPREGPWILPPPQMGLRGSHDGSWEVAHALRDGKTWDTATVDPDGVYDLVVVGGGISGLSAAYFFRKAAGPNARILVLDNHDDFGGHAKRNEFRHADRLLIGYGGTQSIEGPAMRRRGQGAPGGARHRRQEVLQGVRSGSLRFSRSPSGVFFDRETFGVDRLVVEDKTGEGGRDEKARRRAFAAQAPFTEKARHDFLRLHEEPVDYLPGLSADEKRARLKRISYADFLRDYARVDPQVIAYFQQRPHGEAGVGIDAISALESLDFPGFQGMGLTGRRGQPGRRGGDLHLSFSGRQCLDRPSPGASLIPGVASGNTMEDVVTAHFDYARLDEADSPIRIRLNSTAVKVRHLGTPEDSRGVAVIYVRGGAARKVRARRCVLACYHSIIPASARSCRRGNEWRWPTA